MLDLGWRVGFQFRPGVSKSWRGCWFGHKLFGTDGPGTAQGASVALKRGCPPLLAGLWCGAQPDDSEQDVNPHKIDHAGEVICPRTQSHLRTGEIDSTA